jgi:hypothetical protein
VKVRGLRLKAGAGQTSSVGKVISTRRASGDPWQQLIASATAPPANGTPIGEWTLTIASDSLDLFSDGRIDDILFVITYAAALPAWV